MDSTVIAEVDQLLASLAQLKPPGASKGKITAITQLCVSNIKDESNLVQSLYRAAKKAPATHKLGAIYVIDSVVRRWIDQAKALGQAPHPEGRGEAGTYPAAVKRVTELMPALFNDCVRSMPPEQREKLDGMLNIWEKGGTFPANMLNEFKAEIGRLQQSQPGVHGSHAANGSLPIGTKYAAVVPTRPLMTPVGFPPQHVYDQGFLPGRHGPPGAPKPQPLASTPQPALQPQAAVGTAPPAPSQDVNSILAALANAVPAPVPQTPQHIPHQPMQSVVTQQQPQLSAQFPPNALAQLPPNIAALFGMQSSTPSQPPAQTQFQLPAGFAGFPQPPAPQPAPSLAAPTPSFTQQNAHLIPQAQNAQPYSSHPHQNPIPPQAPQNDLAAMLAPLAGILPANILGDQQKLVKALTLLQDLQKDGVPQEMWAPVIKALEEQSQSPAQTSAAPYQTQHLQQTQRYRDRSRSPDRNRGRGSPDYGSYDPRSQNTVDRGRYRQRSPIRSPLPQTAQSGHFQPPLSPGNGQTPGGRQKFIGIDTSLPRDSIKVLSRTLFVGGANGTQAEINALFSRFGEVQTCIANRDRRHAFVKMTTRNYAVAAKEGLDQLQAAGRDVSHVARQTKWGVGFGPRECCDYARGESIIPINKLTEADMKWLLTAEFGGTGGKQIEAGMVLEEPDIEIGAGVSSKAMSRRVAADGGAPGKPQRGFGKDRRRGGGGSSQYQGLPHDGGMGAGQHGGQTAGGGAGKQGPNALGGHARPEPVAVATPPAVPGFGGFTLTGMPPI